MATNNNKDVANTPMKALNAIFDRPDIKKKINDVTRNNAPQFMTTVLQLVNGSAQLAECTPISIVNGALMSASMGLEINNNFGFAYLIPYNNSAKGVKEAQFQLGYMGYKQLALNTGQFLIENATDVREGEYIGIDRMTGKRQFNWIVDDNERKQKPVIAYLHYFKLATGLENMIYMTIEDLREHGRKYSKTYNSPTSKWKTDEAAMCLKTVTKQNIRKNAPKSTENLAFRKLRLAIDVDQSVIKDFDGENATFDYVDRVDDAEVVQATAKDKANAAVDATIEKIKENE